MTRAESIGPTNGPWDGLRPIPSFGLASSSFDSAGGVGSEAWAMLFQTLFSSIDFRYRQLKWSEEDTCSTRSVGGHC